MVLSIESWTLGSWVFFLDDASTFIFLTFFDICTIQHIFQIAWLVKLLDHLEGDYWHVILHTRESIYLGERGHHTYICSWVDTDWGHIQHNSGENAVRFKLESQGCNYTLLNCSLSIVILPIVSSTGRRSQNKPKSRLKRDSILGQIIRNSKIFSWQLMQFSLKFKFKAVSKDRVKNCPGTRNLLEKFANEKNAAWRNSR